MAPSGRTHSDIEFNALHSVAVACNKEMKGVDKNDVGKLAEVTSRHLEKVKPMGFSKTDLLVEIGYINGVLQDKRNLY